MGRGRFHDVAGWIGEAQGAGSWTRRTEDVDARTVKAAGTLGCRKESRKKEKERKVETWLRGSNPQQGEKTRSSQPQKLLDWSSTRS